MDFMNDLKTSTHPVHRELEQLVLFKKIMTHEITLEEYKQLICYFYGFIYPCEQKILSQHQELLLGREKTPLLYSDLVALKCKIEKITLFSPPSTTFNTTADIFGYLYVMEGATLGGQVMLKSLMKNPQLPPDLATHYFNTYGKQTNEKWHVFTQLLKNKMSHQHEQQTAILSAMRTFTSLHQWLQMSIGE